MHALPVEDTCMRCGTIAIGPRHLAYSTSSPFASPKRGAVHVCVCTVCERYKHCMHAGPCGKKERDTAPRCLLMLRCGIPHWPGPSNTQSCPLPTILRLECQCPPTTTRANGARRRGTLGPSGQLYAGLKVRRGLLYSKVCMRYYT